jgi:hypothetical protein
MFLKSESVRGKLPQSVEKVDRTGSPIEMGVNPKRPIYELVATSSLPAGDLASFVHVTADRARKNWSDLRATARLFDVGFVITIGGRELALFRRHPDHSPTWPKRWLAEHSARQRSASPPRTETKIEKLERQVRALNARVARLEKDRGND